MITIEINGVKFEGFQEISVSKNIETISGSFSFAATSDNVTIFPIKRSDPCKVFINNESVINGFVDTINVSYDSNSHSIGIQGRDRTSDIIDSTVIGVKDFIAPITLEGIIRKVLDDNGLSSIPIVNEAGTIETFPTGTQFSAETGQTVFDFIESYTRKRQVLLTTNGDGDLVIARAGSVSAITSLQNKLDGQTNNIKNARMNYSSISLFNKYVLKSQQNIGALSFGADVDPANAVNRSGEATDSSIRTTRQLEIPSNTSDDNVDLGNLAVWNANLRRARATTFSVVVQGHHQDEAQTRLWKPNELVQVEDQFADINAILLVKSVEYNLSLSGGSTTTIDLVPKDSYTLQAELDATEANANKQGENLIFGE